MGGGINSGYPKSTNTRFKIKRRCLVEGCKKKAIGFIDDKPFCKKHYGVTIL